MQLFYSTLVDHTGGELTGQEAVHCSRVLRHRTGQFIRVVDGLGSYFTGEITHVQKDRVTFNVVHEEKAHNEDLPLIAFGILKNESRMEWMLEKLVETGVSRVIPLICDRSEKRRLRRQRMERIMISAMKQSGRALLPELSEPVSFREWLAGSLPPHLAVAHYHPNHRSLQTLMQLQKMAGLVIGPEGDFSPEEIDLVHHRKIPCINLGRYRLRAETAALVACALLNP